MCKPMDWTFVALLHSSTSVRVGWIFVEYFNEVGDYIQRAWSACNRDEETLPDYARLIRGEIETVVWQNTIFRALTVGDCSA